MKYAVNMSFHTGIARILIALLFSVGLWVCDASAAEVRWEVLPDRERVTVTLNKEEGFAGEVTRIDTKGLLLDLGVPTAGMGQNIAPENAKFFAMSEPRGRALGFFMKTAAFGFVVTRPDTRTVIINAFSDILGERWTRDGVAPKPDQAVETTTGNAPPSGGGVGSAAEGELENAPATQANTSASSQRLPALAETSVTSSSAGVEAPGIVRGRIERTTQPAQSSGVPAALPRSPATASAIEVSPVGSALGQGGTSPVSVTPEQNVSPVRQETALASPSANATPASSSAEGGTLSPVGAASGGDGTVFRSRLNPGVLSDWSDMQRGAVPMSAPAPSPEGQRGGATTPEGNTPEAPPAKIYVDAQGNPVPPPPDPVEALAEISKDIGSGKFKDALGKIAPLLTHPELTREQTEEVLHLNAEIQFMANQNDLTGHYDAIVSATIAAMNYNQNSLRNAGAYLRLGYINLKVGNIVEADAYFTRLRRQYPLDENIALTYYYWGEYYYGRNEMQNAADQFQYIISNYSENKYARDAALGLARSYAALGYYEEAFDIIDYVERRWPRLYLESPPVLELMGDVAFRQGNLDFALNKYMVYYNLMPNGPSADVILTRIGDTYARKRMLGPAKTAYMEAERLFPQRDGGLVAMMRLAEVGINDSPEIQEMFSIFTGPFTLKPVEIYNKIIKDHPQSPLVPLAQLKLAMWYLWSKQYEQTLALCSDLVKKFPTHELAPRAEEVAMKAFAALATEGATQNRSGQVIASWSSTPIIRKQEESLLPESRVALAVSMWKQNDPDGALAMVAPMLQGRKDPTYSEQALLLALNINVEHDQWAAIEKLATQIELWELTEKTKLQCDYALAISKENLGKSTEAAIIWSRLAGKSGLDDKQLAYVEYFLARDAENNRRLQDAYLMGRSALNRFYQIAQASPDQADTPKINSLLASLMDICETSGRLNEALEYATQYISTLPEGASQRQGMLFRIAGIYKKQGNTPEWQKVLTELSQNYPDSVHGRAAASTLRSSKLAEDAAQFAPGGQL